MAESETKVTRSEYTVVKPFEQRRKLLAKGDKAMLRPDQAERLTRDGYVAPAPPPPEKGKAKDVR